MNTSKTNLLVIGVVVLVVVAIVAFSLGKQKTESELEPLVEVAFPAAPEVIKSFAGKVVALEGNNISLEILDPDEHLPSQTPKKEVRKVIVVASTKIALVDFINLDDNGRARQITLSLSDLLVGDTITVMAAENIRSAKEFEVTDILVSRDVDEELNQAFEDSDFQPDDGSDIGEGSSSSGNDDEGADFQPDSGEGNPDEV